MRAAGEHIDRYEIRRVLGRGGMGEVYEAHDSRLGRTVALKVLLEGGDDSSKQRLLREARAVAAFEHPNAVVVFDVGVDGDVAYLAMELVKGRPLRELVGDASVSLTRRLRWLVDAARALAAAHRAGLVHRDVKPDNLMVREDDSVKVLDFGIARAHSAPVNPTGPTSAAASPGIGTLTAAGAFIGTPAYAAPEQLRGEGLDGRADQFSWGVMAYELCTGKLPWQGDAVAILSQILTASPPSPVSMTPDLPPAVGAVILRTLEKRPDDRFPAMADVANAIAPFLAVEQASEAPSVTSAPARVERRRSRLPLVGAGALAAIGTLGWGLLRTRDVDPSHGVRGPPIISRLACDTASLDGTTDSTLARAIGVGACARVALELGVPWVASSGPATLTVRARVPAGGVQVTLRASGHDASGAGATPIDALETSSVALAKTLRAPPLPAARIADWGAKDAPSARRIERAWQRMSLRLSARPDVDATGLIASDPGSPWPYALLAIASDYWGSAGQPSAIVAALERVDKLPAARARSLRGYLEIVRAADAREHGLRSTRAAYEQAPGDAEVVALHALALIYAERTDEAVALVERFSSTFPTQSLFVLGAAITMLGDRTIDFERDRRFVDRMVAAFPEARAWPHVIDVLTGHGLVDEARGNLEFGERFGTTSAANASMNVSSRVKLSLVALEPRAARAQAMALMSDPAPRAAARGVRYTIASYWMEGRAVEARTARSAEIQRDLGRGNATGAAIGSNIDLQYRRWLNEPPPPEDRIVAMETALGTVRNLPESLVVQMRCELALARLRRKASGARELGLSLLSEVESRAEKKDDDKVERDALLAETVALVRALRGDAAAARRWADAARAPAVVRHFVAVDAALALEATGDAIGAEGAYSIAKSATYLEHAPFEYVLAHIRLADLYRKRDRPDDAAKLDAVMKRLWTKADPDLLDKVRRMR